MVNNTFKTMWPKHHTNEKQIGDILGLLPQKYFWSIFLEEWWTHYWVKELYHATYLNKFISISSNGRFEYLIFISQVSNIWKITIYKKLK